ADSLPREAENRLEGKFRYLLHNYGKDAVAGFVVVEPGMLREWSPWSAVDTCRSYSRNLMYDGDVVVPHSFCAMRLVDDYNATFRRMENRKVAVSVDSVEFTLDVDSVRRFYNNTGAASMETPILCSPTDGRDDRLLVLQRLYYYYPTDDSLTSLGISGVVFKR
ncbi:MAG: hypothetical protein K2L49_03820, partial [Muribaculaceae bacterium]|nr:hypothetical protein [Muribaculaceae bacterium]